MASLVCALAGIDAKASGRIGQRAVIYYLCTTVAAVILGILVVSIIRPDSQAKPSEEKEITPYRPLDAFLDLLGKQELHDVPVFLDNLNWFHQFDLFFRR